MARSRKKTLYIADQSDYTTDPSADGSGYTPVPALMVNDPSDNNEQLPTEYYTGRPYDTANETGPDSADLEFETPLIGLSTAAGDGTDASTVANDWLDLLLRRVMGLLATTSGEGVASATASTITLDSDSHDAHDILPVYDANALAGARTQFARITVDSGGGVYTVSPNWAGTPTGTAIAYGVHNFTFDEDNSLYLAAVVVDDDVGTYRHLGGRITGLRISAPTGRIARARWSVRFDTKVEDASAKSALPAAVNAPAVTPLKAMLSPVQFGNTFYDTAGIEFDLGIETAPVDATVGANGRSGDEAITCRPSMTITPLRTDAILNLKRNATEGDAMMQLGGGVLSGGVINAMSISFGNAQVTETPPTDDRGHARQSMTITAKDTGATGEIVQIARA